MASGILFFLFGALGAPWVAHAETLPCLDNRSRPLELNNEQVLEWKRATRNQYRDRGFVRGTLVSVLKAKRDHLHLDVFLGTGDASPGPAEHLEVIYNQQFGRVDSSALESGAEVIACGDYITSTAKSGHFPPSPLGAILHWAHKKMRGDHPDGFLMIHGKLYGQQDAPPKRRRFFWDESFIFAPAFAN